MRDDGEELDKLNEAEKRLSRRQPEHERIRRPVAPDADLPAAGHPTHGGASVTHPEEAVPGPNASSMPVTPDATPEYFAGKSNGSRRER